MKLLAALILLSFSTQVKAQTYFYVSIQTNYYGGYYPAVDVPTNTLCKLLNANANAISFGAYSSPLFSNSITGNIEQISSFGVGTSPGNSLCLGPGKIFLWKGGVPNDLLLEFDTVNTTPSLQGYAVQPNGKTATIQLQTSSDLTNWQPATNGTYPATNSAAFYRMSLQMN